MKFARAAGTSAIYVGESGDLNKRAYHYRNPGPRQQTSLRINGLLRTELQQGVRVEVDTVAHPTLMINEEEVPVDFSRKPVRLLFENAVLVELSSRGKVEAFNL